MERKELTQEEILKELKEIENDSELTEEEKEMSTKIYNAELERQRKDERIDLLRKQIKALRMKIIDDIINIMPTLDEEKKEMAQDIINELGYPLSADFDMLSEAVIYNQNDVVGEQKMVVTGTVEGQKIPGVESVAIYLDDEIHKKRENLWELERKLGKVIKSKYENISDELEGIIDPEMFELDSKVTEDKKSSKEIDEIYTKELKKINEMDIYSNEKGILKNILNDAMKYIISDGLLEFDDLGEYVAEAMKQATHR